MDMGPCNCHTAMLLRGAMREAENALYRAIYTAHRDLEMLRHNLSQAETAWLTHTYTCFMCRKQRHDSSGYSSFFGVEGRGASWSIAEFVPNALNWSEG